MLGKRGHGMSLGPGFFFGGLLALVSGLVPFFPAVVIGLIAGEGSPPKAVYVVMALATLVWWAFIVYRGYGWHLLAMLAVFGIAFAIVRCIN